MLERRRRVGYTIDMSVNLGNLSHFDGNDALQGYSVWTEEMLGLGQNWYFVIPNVHGLRPDGKTKFHGMAVKLGHGVAISWDGRVIRHCMLVSCPDGMEFGYVTRGRDSLFLNHLYRTFTAAKEKIVRAGRARCAASYRPRVPSSVNVKKACKKRRKRGGRRPGRDGPRVGTDSAAVATKSVWPAAVEWASGETAVELPAIELLPWSFSAGSALICNRRTSVIPSVFFQVCSLAISQIRVTGIRTSSEKSCNAAVIFNLALEAIWVYSCRESPVGDLSYTRIPGDLLHLRKQSASIKGVAQRRRLQFK
jgi:hypothetical protein